MISFAIFGPTIQGRIITTMPAPNLSSGSPKKASCAAMVMSQASANSHAPARHGPRTAAMVGLGAVPEPHHRIEVLAQDRLATAPTPGGGAPSAP